MILPCTKLELGRNNHQQTAAAPNQKEWLGFWTNQPATTLRLARADPSGQRWGTTDAETEVLFAEASEVSKAVAFVVTSGAGWNIALRSLTTARNHVVLISVFPDR